MTADKIIVIVTSGKNESVDYVKVVLFDKFLAAHAYVEATSDTEKKKHWTTAEIVPVGRTIDLCDLRPEFD